MNSKTFLKKLVLLVTTSVIIWSSTISLSASAQTVNVPNQEIISDFKILFNDLNSTDLLILRSGSSSGLFTRALVSSVDFNNISTVTLAYPEGVRGDYNGDGNVDKIYLTRDNMSGVIYRDVDYQDGLTGETTNLIYDYRFRNWQLAAAGDVNGDGKDELFLRNWETGENMLWFLTNLSSEGLVQKPVVTVEDQDWVVKDIADIDGDGREEILWENIQSRQIDIWSYSDNEEITSKTIEKVVPDNWSVEGLGNSDGDQRAEIILLNSNNELISWSLLKDDYSKIESENTIVNLAELAQKLSNNNEQKNFSYFVYDKISNKL